MFGRPPPPPDSGALFPTPVFDPRSPELIPPHAAKTGESRERRHRRARKNRSRGPAGPLSRLGVGARARRQRRGARRRGVGSPRRGRLGPAERARGARAARPSQPPGSRCKAAPGVALSRAAGRAPRRRRANSGNTHAHPCTHSAAEEAAEVWGDLAVTARPNSCSVRGANRGRNVVYDGGVRGRVRLREQGILAFLLLVSGFWTVNLSRQCARSPKGAWAVFMKANVLNSWPIEAMSIPEPFVLFARWWGRKTPSQPIDARDPLAAALLRATLRAGVGWPQFGTQHGRAQPRQPCLGSGGWCA